MTRILCMIGLYLVGYFMASGTMFMVCKHCADKAIDEAMSNPRFDGMLAYVSWASNEKPLIGKSYGSVLYKLAIIGLWPIMVPAETVHVCKGLKKCILEPK